MEKRNSNIEILRIFALMGITFYHIWCYAWGGYSFNDNLRNKIIVDTLSMFGKIGVNVFILISGYYSSYKSFSIKKVLSIEYATVIVSWILLVISFTHRFATGRFLSEGTLHELNFLLKSVFPNLFGVYWFSAAYIIWYLLWPLMAKRFRVCSLKQLRNILILLLCIWSIIPTLTLNVNSGYGWNNYLWFPIPYFAGIYIYRKNATGGEFQSIKIRIALTLSVAFQLLTPWILDSVLNGAFSSFSTYLRNSNSITSVIISFGLFALAVNKKKKHSRIINCLSKGAFCAYLIQEHVMFRSILWNDVFKFQQHAGVLLLLVYMAAFIILLVAGSILQMIIDYTFQSISIKKKKELKAAEDNIQLFLYEGW